jgi:pimeloyl-ACP methyl ester carboxylesterase
MKKLIVIFMLAASFAVLQSCSKNNNIPNPARTYVIVPGAWQAPYAWQYVKADLEQSGNKVIVVQLPGHGTDQTPPQNLTIDVYRDAVVTAINNVNGKVILVGHSLAGVIISEVAEKVPAKIEKLVYIGAYIPSSGQSLLDLANTDTTSLLGQSIRPSADMLTLDVVHDQITNIFIQDGTPSIQNLVLTNYRVEPAIPFTNKVTLTAANYGSVQKFYIKTLQDHAITPTLQKRMLATSGITAIYQLNTSHSPFLSKPDSVAALLTIIAK